MTFKPKKLDRQCPIDKKHIINQHKAFIDVCENIQKNLLKFTGIPKKYFNKG